MSDMLNFCISLIQSIADIISNQNSPLFWLFGVIIFGFVVNIFLRLTRV